MALYSIDLNHREKEIRRVILQPTNLGLSITCSLDKVSLADKPEYEALSYVWGNSTTRQDIMVDNLPFSATQNLAVALQHLQLPDKPRKLWIDAICINQSNVEERNAQVQMMGEIYAHANPVLIWLGEATDESNEAFDLMSATEAEEDITDEAGRRIFSLCFELVKREWFTRLWTVQELALANRDPIVGCGSKWMPWSILSRAWQRVAMREFEKMQMVMPESRPGMESGGDTDLVLRTSGIKLDLLINIRAAASTRGGDSLRNLLLHTNTSQVTEPKDRIYALLGMMSKQDREKITVDYSRDVGTVFAGAVAHIFEKGQGPFFLSGLELTGPMTSASTPSWVPNFGSKSLLSPSRFHAPGIGASGDGSNCTNGAVSDDLKTLRVRGLYIDTVAEIIEFGHWGECLSRLPEVEELAVQARQLAACDTNDRPYLKPFKSKEPLWRTLITNRAYTGATREVAPHSYGAMYEILLRKQRNESGQSCADESTRDYELSLMNYLPCSRFFITATGFCGIGPEVIEKGDQIAIWFGSPAPFILRPHPQPEAEQNGTIFAVVCVAYVAGIMDGEMVNEVYCEDLEDDIVFTVQ